MHNVYLMTNLAMKNISLLQNAFFFGHANETVAWQAATVTTLTFRIKLS